MNKFFKCSLKRYEPIEEPLKYGQLRNYLKPASIKHPKSKSNAINNAKNVSYVRKLDEK